MKTCNRCNKEKDESEFVVHSRYGRQAACRQCIYGNRKKSPPCKIDDCNSPTTSKATGYCDKHHRRFTRHGDPMATKIDHLPYIGVCYTCSGELGSGGRNFCGSTCRDRAGHIRRTYGLTIQEYRRWYEWQEGKCAICNKHMKKICIDHNHTTGVARGLLCGNCNSMIGLAKEDPETLRAAARYVEWFNYGVVDPMDAMRHSKMEFLDDW